MPFEGTHRRYNPLLDEWVLCSPRRLDRPWQGQREAASAAPPTPVYDSDCYMCPGNRRASGARNPEYDSVFVFDNDFPALSGSPLPPIAEPEGLLRARPERGRCRVLCFSPRHDLSLGGMSGAEIRRVIDAWASQTAALGEEEGIGYVQLFENRGEMMGCSNPHPHCQIWAVGSLPTLPARKLRNFERYFETHGRDLLGDYLEAELREQVRLVCANREWVALVPFWAVWPFEVMVLPRRACGSLPDLTDTERDMLGEIMKRLLEVFDRLFEAPFPYSMGWFGRPTGGGPHPGWRLHAVYYPPLLRSATVRKFLVGYELTAEPQRDLTPEEAAARLRARL